MSLTVWARPSVWGYSEPIRTRSTSPMSASSPFFFFNDTATTEIYTLSLHDALPICTLDELDSDSIAPRKPGDPDDPASDRKSTRLNSSHANISYAVFCLKKKQHPRGRRVVQAEKALLDEDDLLPAAADDIARRVLLD